jgi:DNA-directed RNA polymerase sigma subunit (sigma70/sigma32)
MRKRVPESRLKDARDKYEAGETLTQIGETMGCSPEWVRQLLKRTSGQHRARGYNRKPVQVIAKVE